MYTVIIPNSVKKDLKKLNRPTINKIINLLESLSENPFQGISLAGDFSNLLKLEFRQQGIHYRIVYHIVKEKVEVYVLHIGTRENFYAELKRRM
ncbi:MAG: type II toxin-antitoxin system RelE/ParE family toxin [Candidatus Bathyarchaeota archaeon]|nr:type II toxin-antitoxin system RelE/ParE family toxin [Candidatus Bathyarchaeota archaeon]